TDIGDILIAMNPFQPLPLYGREVSPLGPSRPGPSAPPTTSPTPLLPQAAERYRHQETGTLPPHIFAVASRAYHAMLGRRGGGPQSQCIVI
ncbi:MYO9A protein, partial [Zapornia atra]|nr:MYO9A protein [Zapornia atra]